MMKPIKLRFFKNISKYQINSRRPTHKDRHDFHQGTRYCEIWNQRFERAILNCYIAELFLSDKSVTLTNSLFKALSTIYMLLFQVIMLLQKSIKQFDGKRNVVELIVTFTPLLTGRTIC